jgi:hypothetical protein
MLHYCPIKGNVKATKIVPFSVKTVKIVRKRRNKNISRKDKVSMNGTSGIFYEFLSHISP